MFFVLEQLSFLFTVIQVTFIHCPPIYEPFCDLFQVMLP